MIGGGHSLTFSAFKCYVHICVKEMESLNPIMSSSQGTLSNNNKHPQYLSGLSRALLMTTFHKIYNNAVTICVVACRH